MRVLFFFNDTATTEIYTLSLHDALPICKKGGEFGIAALVSVVDICTANNTIAIVMAGPIAKDIADKYDIDPRRSASILDTFSCFFQGIIPYGAQILTAVGVAGSTISPFDVMKYLYYPYLMGICAIDRKSVV